MNYDFIEIGTSNFSTLIQEADNSTYGISVEPIKYYLDQLPDKLTVKKINCGISFDDSDNDITIYYIPESTIIEHNLAWWLKGCNATNDYHPMHRAHNLCHLVERATVRAMPISKLFIENNVEQLTYLKIDTEGGDTDILLNLIKYLKIKSSILYPKTIKFETNQLTPIHKVNDVIFQYTALGYHVAHRDQDDTVLKFSNIIV